MFKCWKVKAIIGSNIQLKGEADISHYRVISDICLLSHIFFRKSLFKLTPFFVKATLIMAPLASQDKSGRCK